MGEKCGWRYVYMHLVPEYVLCPCTGVGGLVVDGNVIYYVIPTLFDLLI